MACNQPTQLANPKGSRKKSDLPDVPWAANGNLLTLELLSEMEKRENAKVLFAKEKGEVSQYSHFGLLSTD